MTKDKKKDEIKEWAVSDKEKGMLQNIEDDISGLYKQVGFLESQKTNILNLIPKHKQEAKGIVDQMRYKYGIPSNVQLEYDAKEGKLRRK